MRKDFCEFLLDLCPCLREYGNVSYKFSDTMTMDANSDDSDSISTVDAPSHQRKSEPKIVAQVLHIEVPD